AAGEQPVPDLRGGHAVHVHARVDPLAVGDVVGDDGEAGDLAAPGDLKVGHRAGRRAVDTADDVRPLRLEVAVQPLQPHPVDRPLHGRVGPDLPGGLVEHAVHDRRPADALDVRELGDGVEHGVDEPGEVVDDLRAAPGPRLPV